jgi:hypothetical protein
MAARKKKGRTRKKAGAKKPIEQYDHRDKERVNTPVPSGPQGALSEPYKRRAAQRPGFVVAARC